MITTSVLILLSSEVSIPFCMVVADALPCQRETVKAIASKQAEYLLSVKANQPTLRESIADYVQDDTLRKTMDTEVMVEKNGGRVE